MLIERIDSRGQKGILAEQLATVIVESMDMDELISFAIDQIVENYLAGDDEVLLQEYNDRIGGVE